MATGLCEQVDTLVVEADDREVRHRLTRLVDVRFHTVGRLTPAEAAVT